jgi:hypothetical protein
MRTKVWCHVYERRFVLNENQCQPTSIHMHENGVSCRTCAQHASPLCTAHSNFCFTKIVWVSDECEWRVKSTYALWVAWVFPYVRTCGRPVTTSGMRLSHLVKKITWPNEVSTGSYFTTSPTGRTLLSLILTQTDRRQRKSTWDIMGNRYPWSKWA